MLGLYVINVIIINSQDIMSGMLLWPSLLQQNCVLVYMCVYACIHSQPLVKCGTICMFPHQVIIFISSTIWVAFLYPRGWVSPLDPGNKYYCHHWGSFIRIRTWYMNSCISSLSQLIEVCIVIPILHIRKPGVRNVHSVSQTQVRTGTINLISFRKEKSFSKF